MDLRQAVLGIAIVLVFWAFQAGFLNFLGIAQWFLAVLLFGILTWLIGQGVMPKPSASQKELWTFTLVLGLAIGAVVSFVPWDVLGIQVPAGAQPSQFTPAFLSVILALYGAAMVVTGWELKWNITLLTGLFWLLSSVHFATFTGPNSWIHFAIVTGFPFIVYGLLAKD